MTTRPGAADHPFGQIFIPELHESALPLKHTRVEGRITGPLATVSVRQVFTNPIDHPVELEYLFPLSDTAAVFDFELRAGQRVIKASIQELGKAREIYDEALNRGQQAALLEERRPNLFAVRVANVLPGADIETVLRYEDPMEYSDGAFLFVFPMGLTPRYHSREQEGPAGGRETDAPITRAPGDVGPVEIHLSADLGLPAGEPYSSSHAIRVERLDERRFSIQLAGREIPDHDFVLTCPVEARGPLLAAWSTPIADGRSNSEYFLALLAPPRQDDVEAAHQPREYVFVLDRSGSMHGAPIAQARNALRASLRTLLPDDMFRILLFDDQLDWYRPEPCPATQEEIDQADRFLETVEGRGGTEIVAAIQAALDLPPNPRRETQRVVVFLTDGAVSAESQALERIRRKIHHARLFTFGIGPSVNRALLRKMAELGRGTAEFLQLDEDIETAIIRFQDRIAFPALRDIEIEWENALSWDVYPNRIHDLYLGQPIQLCGKLKREAGSLPSIGIRARTASGKLTSLRAEFAPTGAPDPAIQRAWAKKRLEDLLEGAASGEVPADRSWDEVIALSLENHLLSPYTAFVAVDHNQAVTSEPARLISVAHPLPKGLDMAGFFRPVPPPAQPFVAMAAAPGIDSMRMPPRSKLRAATTGAVMPASEDAKIGTPANPLNRLARSQNADGSWNGSIERTAVALLAFVRRGHTTHRGSYRVILQKAYAWLTAQVAGAAERVDAWLLALALNELAEATSIPAHRQAAETARARLSQPENTFEQAILDRMTGKVVQTPHGLASLDDLRQAGVAGVKAPSPANFTIPAEQELAEFWSLLVAGS